MAGNTIDQAGSDQASNDHTATRAADPEWYDSGWLAAYYAAKDLIAATCPERLDGFVRTFDPLRTSPDFAPLHLPGAIDPALLERLRAIVRKIPRDRYELHEIQSFGRFVVHDDPEIVAIQADLTDQVSHWAGEAVEPSYNFLSFYTRLAVCEPHLDSPSAKWTLDICLDQSEPWPIQFSQIIPWPERRCPRSPEDIRNDPALRYESVAMVPGDAILFSGSSQWHYRDALPRDGQKRFCDLLFMHFIPRGTGAIVRPANWPDYFGIPELAGIEGLDRAL